MSRPYRLDRGYWSSLLLAVANGSSLIPLDLGMVTLFLSVHVVAYPLTRCHLRHLAYSLVVYPPYCPHLAPLDYAINHHDGPLPPSVAGGVITYVYIQLYGFDCVYVRRVVEPIKDVLVRIRLYSCAGVCCV